MEESFILNWKVIKKDGALEDYDVQKIINACSKSASRALDDLTNDDYLKICNRVEEIIIEENYGDEIPVYDMHNIVEHALMELYPNTGRQYIEYRNYKKNFVRMMDEVYTQSQVIKYIGDVFNN